MNGDSHVLLALRGNEISNSAFQDSFDASHVQSILQLVQKHSVTPLIYRSMKQQPGVPDDMLASLRATVISSSLRNDRMIRIQSEIINQLSSHNIRCAILKGTSVAALYPYSEMRA